MYIFTGDRSFGEIADFVDAVDTVIEIFKGIQNIFLDNVAAESAVPSVF